jgi:tetratricopeptide (TPR) repeat protein
VLPGGKGFKGSVPRRQVWGEYYAALSEVLQGDLPFPMGGFTASAGYEGASVRVLLRAELKKVEMVYQGLLYSETKFPRADEERVEVEDFVRRMMQNWEILNGRGWKEADLGAGGRDSLCHGTLDSLYGAAAKTYHSTAILRHMFTVHLAVAEFDLAFMAFDSWFELVKKGRARVQKTGHREPALDSDAVMFETISVCIAALCRFGSREAAEKAHKLAEELEELVEKEQGRDPESVDPQDEVPSSVLAVAWQSIGLAQAQWARMTYESESRATIQEKAIQCLRRSLSPEFGHAADARAVFALGVLFAEQRKLSASIELVKTALLTDKALSQSQELRLGLYWRERSLIPLWHLLALMLSARQEYFLAARACEGAIEQFKDPFVLFGSKHLTGYRSEHLKDAGIKADKNGDGLVDEMDDFEKESILQIKMTQLAILELVEGPAVAVNASTELLTLFPRLFGDLDQKPELSKAEVPKTSATTRSFRGSVFGGKSEKGPRQSVVNNNNNEKLTTIPSRPQTTQSVATTALTVQSSNDAVPYQSSSRRSEDNKLRSRNSLRKRDRSGSRQRALSSGGPPVPPLDGDKYFAAFDERNLPHYLTPAPKQTVEPPREGSRRSSSRSRAAANSEAAASGKTAGPFTPLLPYVQFSPEHNRRRRRVILVKVWLVIAGFYRRAGLLDDANKAILEGEKVAQGLEADVVNEASGSLSVREAGWGMEKSAEEVIADVWAEVSCSRVQVGMADANKLQKGNLSLARERPYGARADFETALTHFPNHPGAIVGLSNILLDIYTEKLLPPPAVPGLDLSGLPLTNDSIFAFTTDASTLTVDNKEDKFPSLPSAPLGLGPTKPKPKAKPAEPNGHLPSPSAATTSSLLGPPLPPPHRATSLPLNDRLAARDRAYGLLSGLTKLGSGWSDSEAWFALARAYEESGQVDKARDALWWCVELEDGRGVREWEVVGGGYVL